MGLKTQYSAIAGHLGKSEKVLRFCLTAQRFLLVLHTSAMMLTNSPRGAGKNEMQERDVKRFDPVDDRQARSCLTAYMQRGRYDYENTLTLLRQALKQSDVRHRPSERPTLERAAALLKSGQFDAWLLSR